MDRIYLQTSFEKSPTTNYVTIHKIIHMYYLNKSHKLIKIGHTPNNTY